MRAWSAQGRMDCPKGERSLPATPIPAGSPESGVGGVSALRAVRSCFHIGVPTPAAVAVTGRRRHFGPFGDTAGGFSWRDWGGPGAQRPGAVGPNAAITRTAYVSTGRQTAALRRSVDEA